MRNTRHYHTIKQAIGAMSLDNGYNPFEVGQAVIGDDGRRYTRPTKAALAAMGYPVDPAEAEREDRTADEARARHEARQAEANAAYAAARRAEAMREEQRREDRAMAERAFAAAGVSPRPCDIAHFDGGAIVTMKDRKVMIDGDSAKVSPVCIGKFGVASDGSRVSLRGHISRHLVGYVIEGRMGEEEFFKGIKVTGDERKFSTDCDAVKFVVG